MKKWEYIYDTVLTESQIKMTLKDRGASGWELVSVVTLRDETGGYIYIFWKRQIN